MYPSIREQETLQPGGGVRANQPATWVYGSSIITRSPIYPTPAPSRLPRPHHTAPYEKILILEHIAEGSNCRLKSELWQEVLMRQAGL